MENYYNTTNLSGNNLTQASQKAMSQEDRILFHFEDSFDANFTPFEILEAVFNNQIPITSVRRAMTNLTNKGKLVKTGYQRLGAYGRICFAWRLK